jgi:proteasome alpha subunit
LYPVSPSAYDRAITVFSPDGRLFQVEYAKEAVKRGTTAVGIVCSDGVALVAHKNVVSELIVPESMEKIFSVDRHIAATASGLVADARRLVETARIEAQRHKITYNEPISVELLTKKLSDTMQIYTQYGGIRPFGVALLVAGVDGEPRLFETEPSGALTEYKAAAIGSGKKDVEEFFEKEYGTEPKLEEGIALAVKALKKVVEGKLSAKMVDISTISRSAKKFKTLGKDEIANYL